MAKRTALLLLAAILSASLAACENVKRGIYESSQTIEKSRAEDSGVPSEPPPAPTYPEYKEMRKGN